MIALLRGHRRAGAGRPPRSRPRSGPTRRWSTGRSVPRCRSCGRGCPARCSSWPPARRCGWSPRCWPTSAATPAWCAWTRAGGSRSRCAAGTAAARTSWPARVAAVLGATPVITTAADAVGVTAAGRAGRAARRPGRSGTSPPPGSPCWTAAAVRLDNPLRFPLPPLPRASPYVGARCHRRRTGYRIVVDDRALEPDGRTLQLVPPTLVVGWAPSAACPSGPSSTRSSGCAPSTGWTCAPCAPTRAWTARPTRPASWPRSPRPGCAATRQRCWPRSTCRTRSERVRAEVGTPSVAEAAALHAAAELAGGASGRARRAQDQGRGRDGRGGPDPPPWAAGAGRPRSRARTTSAPRAPTPSCAGRAWSSGSTGTWTRFAHLLRPGTEVRASGLGEEEQRAADAVALARGGRAVALVGSGDAGVYAMASPALEQAGADIEVVGVAGVTAALAAAALLGAPLGHDHAVISLSDLHTPWPVIERRVAAAAEADLVTCFYNPRSRERHWQLGAALDVLRKHRPPDTPVGAVRQAGRAGPAGVVRAAGRVRPGGGRHADHGDRRIDGDPDGRRPDGHPARLPLERLTARRASSAPEQYGGQRRRGHEQPTDADLGHRAPRSPPARRPRRRRPGRRQGRRPAPAARTTRTTRRRRRRSPAARRSPG